jgi:hypothetical protein
MTDWIQPAAPVAGAQEIDFAQRLIYGGDVSGQLYSVTLAGVGNLSPGDWTLYMLRLTYLTAPDLATSPVLMTSVSLQTGTDKGRGDLLGLELSTFNAAQDMLTLANLNRGVAFHITGGTIDATIRFQAGTRREDDRLLCWVAPGRPSVTRIEGQAISSSTTIALSRNARMRMPVFSRRVSFTYSNPAGFIVQPFVSFWAGPTLVNAFRMPVPGALQTLDYECMIPQSATHMAIGDDGAGAVAQLFYFQYEIES